jgi:DeoR family deoxyribose operon repressor
VADSSKFGVIKPAYFADLSEVHALVTDGGIPDRYVSLYRETGIELIVAKLR